MLASLILHTYVRVPAGEYSYAHVGASIQPCTYMHALHYGLCTTRSPNDSAINSLMHLFNQTTHLSRSMSPLRTFACHLFIVRGIDVHIYEHSLLRVGMRDEMKNNCTSDHQ